MPLWYRGRDIYDWYVDSGVLDDTVETLPSPAARLACNPTVTSVDVPHLVGPRRLAREGVTLVGRLEALEQSMLSAVSDLDVIEHRLERYEERLSALEDFLNDLVNVAARVASR